MNYRKCLAAGLMLAATLAMPSSVKGADGNELMKWAVEHEKDQITTTDSAYQAGRFLGYVTGVWEMSSVFSPPNVTNGQLCAVVIKYLRAHPEKWNEPGSSIVIDAIREAWPQKAAAPAGR
jgi:hypothetical protein